MTTGNQTPNDRTILFASPHCLLDFTAGAAVASARALQLLATLGFHCHAFCGTLCDAPIPLNELLSGLAHSALPAASIIETALEGPDCVPVSMFAPPKPEPHAFLDAYTKVLDLVRPAVLLTYGGDPLSREIVRLAKTRGATVVFLLHNFTYSNPQTFASVDCAVVPSEFSRRYYADTLGLLSHVLPNVLEPRQSEARHRQSSYVTFVNPQPAKGIYVFARIAEELARRRSDIPLLVVEGRSRGDWREATGIALERLPNLETMAATSDPRQFYAVTKLLVMPSLWNESFGLVAAEAMLNGIPVLASNRGALPETLGETGFLLDIPARYTPQSRELPTPREVQPWVEMIERLWDGEEFYRRTSEAARGRAECWLPERLAGAYRDFFSSVMCQRNSPPSVPVAAGPKTPLISVVLAVHNGIAALDHAVLSVLGQTFTDWELLTVDDGSTDGTYEALQAWAVRDARIRVFRLDENSGPSAARNAAFRQARGEFVTYLDHDDEYYSDYLAHVAAWRTRADVLVLGYDLVENASPHLNAISEQGAQARTWWPTEARRHLFIHNMVVPLGMAHRRSLIDEGGWVQRTGSRRA